MKGAKTVALIVIVEIKKKFFFVSTYRVMSVFNCAVPTLNNSSFFHKTQYWIWQMVKMNLAYPNPFVKKPFANFVSLMWITSKIRRFY